MKYIARVLVVALFVGNFAFLVSRFNDQSVVIVTKDVPVAMQNVSADDIAKELLTRKSYLCLRAIITKESHGNPSAKNPDSTARGIGQLLTSTYKNLGMRHSTDEQAQLIALLAYIGRKYGSGGPCAAWRFHKQHNYF